MSTKKIEEALRKLSDLQSSVGTSGGYNAVGKLVADARVEVDAIKKAAISHTSNRRLWRKIAEES